MTITVDNAKAEVQLWDPQNGYDPSQTFYKGMHFLIAVFAKDSKDSLEKIAKLIDDAFNHVPKPCDNI